MEVTFLQNNFFGNPFDASLETFLTLCFCTGVKGSGGQERRLVSQLMTLLDSLHETGNLVVIAATNRPQAVDPSLRRAGRFDKEVSRIYKHLSWQFLKNYWCIRH